MNLNTLKEFRHQIYPCFKYGSDGLFNLADALLTESPAQSVLELPLSPLFERKWPSLYEALQMDQLNQTRFEQILPISPTKSYPFCTYGSRILPPEECGGPEALMEIEPKLELALWRKKARLVEIMAKILPKLQKEEGLALIEKHRAELKKILEQLEAAKFERGEINRQLKLYGSTKIWHPKEMVLG